MIILSQLWYKLCRISNFNRLRANLKAESAGNGVLRSDEKNFSVHKTYINFSRPPKRAPEAVLYALRWLLPQNVTDTTQPDDDVYDTKMCRKAESAGNGGLYSGEKNFSVHKTYMNFLRPRKRAPGAALYALRGRSMVEMLGVLAIIGVLSVGAISGYQKAMFKHKLNKHAEAVNILINNSLQMKDKLAFEKNKVTYFNDLFHKLNLVPDGMKYQDKSTFLDPFNNKVNIFYNNESYDYNGKKQQNNFGGLTFYFEPTQTGFEICRNIVQSAKENSANLWLVETYKYYNDSSSSTIHGYLYGDSFCGKNLKCLHNLTLTDIENLCHVCNEKLCHLYVLWK